MGAAPLATPSFPLCTFRTPRWGLPGWERPHGPHLEEHLDQRGGEGGRVQLAHPRRQDGPRQPAEVSARQAAVCPVFSGCLPSMIRGARLGERIPVEALICQNTTCHV